jgi:aldehyde dehydrogenase (NAD+)
LNPLKNLSQQYIGRLWRDGSSNEVPEDVNPNDGMPIAKIKLASVADVDAAYRSTAEAQ